MKTIGIKLADGTFYPVLEEGTPKKRKLDLTTAKDNQTKVQIDLYRSENGTMEDAEYVDTLEVTTLNPHPNGEPELHLSVGLDENNKLTAEVVDPETGKKSETEVSLVSRTAEERSEPNEFGVSGVSVSEETVAENPTEATFSPEELPDMGATALEDMPFSFDYSEPNAAGNSSSVATENFDGSLPDFSDLDEDIPVEDKTLESVDFANTENAADSDIQADTTTIEESDEDATISDKSEDFSTEEFSLPDLDSNNDFADVSSDADSFDSDTTLPDFSDDTIAASDTSENTEPEGFDLPDFDAPVTDGDPFTTDSSSETSATGIDFDDLDDPAFSSTDFGSDSSTDDDFFGTSSSDTSSSAMDFSDLYDKETMAGEHASLYDEEEEEKKTRTPVIICIICAIICVIATILLLFVVPSKYNLLASRNTNGVSILDRFFSKTEKVVETSNEEPKEETKYIDIVVEEPKNEAAPEAVEDKIVIAPEPEKVVPKPAPIEEKKLEVKNTSDVKYHIKWGDTLWDLSESYYKTPWKYPKIADYNKIKNPDLIISGTDILIPAE